MSGDSANDSADDALSEQQQLQVLTASLFRSQEDERRRIARELHDDVSQRLAAIEIEADKIDKSLPDSATAVRDGLHKMRTRITELSEDVRRMSDRLHPSIVEDLGLQRALASLTDQFGRNGEMIASFSCDAVPQNVPFDVAIALYRITEEALRNVAKHGGRTHARVSLNGTKDGLQLQVADFGEGFDIECTRPRLGLLAMRERARAIGATLEVHSALGEGTRVKVIAPHTVL